MCTILLEGMRTVLFLTVIALHVFLGQVPGKEGCRHNLQGTTKGFSFLTLTVSLLNPETAAGLPTTNPEVIYNDSRIAEICQGNGGEDISRPKRMDTRL